MCSWALLNNADRRPQRRVVFHDNFVPRLTDSSGQQLPPVSVRLQFLLPSDTMETRKQTSFDASFASRPARRAVIVTRHLLHGRVSSAAAAAVRVLIDDVEWSEEHECVNHPRFLRGEEEKAEANGGSVGSRAARHRKSVDKFDFIFYLCPNSSSRVGDDG